MSLSSTIEVDTRLIGWAWLYGLCKYVDGEWEATDLGNRLVLEYLRRERPNDD